MNDKIDLDRLKLAHGYHLSMLQFSEAKNGGLIALCGAMTVLTKPSDLLEALVILALIASASISLLTFIPVTKKTERSKRSLLFYKDVLSIANNDSSFGLNSLEQFDSEGEDYIHQIRELSQLTQMKMDKFRLACFFLILAFLLFIIVELLELCCG